MRVALTTHDDSIRRFKSLGRPRALRTTTHVNQNWYFIHLIFMLGYRRRQGTLGRYPLTVGAVMTVRPVLRADATLTAPGRVRATRWPRIGRTRPSGGSSESRTR